MNEIEKIKEQLAMNCIIGILEEEDIKNLPKDNDLRTFVCSLGPCYAYYYARNVDKCPTEETRIAACKNSWDAYRYALRVDERATKETRTSACGISSRAFYYARDVDKKPTDETRIAACKDLNWVEEYKEFEREYNERHRKN
jgi:hypothetical protein